MSATYDRNTKYVTITDPAHGDVLVQKCHSIAEARRIAR